jgi:hypothetical protein
MCAFTCKTIDFHEGEFYSIHSLEAVCRGSVVGKATAYELDFEFLKEQEFSLVHIVQICTGAHSASYPMVPGVFSPKGKAARA